MLEPPEEYDLTQASDTDDVNRLAAGLAAWALRQGMHPDTVVDWVLEQPREVKLPRGTHGLNATAHHVRKGAEYAVDTFDPAAARPTYDAAPIEALRKRIKASGLKQEPYLLGVTNLCDKYETVTPVITGANLAEASGKGKRGADKVVAEWARTFAYGLFTGVRHDGVRGHGRVWTVNVEWEPIAPTTHEKGCRRGDRCTCAKSAQNSVSILTADKIDALKRARFERWLQGLPAGSPVTVADCRKATGLTAHKAGQRLRDAEGTLLKEGTWEGGWVRKNGRRVRQGETWFTP